MRQPGEQQDSALARALRAQACRKSQPEEAIGSSEATCGWVAVDGVREFKILPQVDSRLSASS